MQEMDRQSSVLEAAQTTTTAISTAVRIMTESLTPVLPVALPLPPALAEELPEHITAVGTAVTVVVKNLERDLEESRRAFQGADLALRMHTTERTLAPASAAPSVQPPLVAVSSDGFEENVPHTPRTPKASGGFNLGRLLRPTSSSAAREKAAAASASNPGTPSKMRMPTPRKVLGASNKA